ncbi:MAG: protease inhibitor I9 family protein, partial [Actinobacteria bacterium]|nr:protease inhibitor I9 family protein [Actinomycetota bacterium]
MRAATVASAILVALTSLAVLSPSPVADVIVRARAGAETQAARAVESSGGTVGRGLPVIDGFAAKVPERAVAALRTDPSVASITPDASLHLLHMVDGCDPNADVNSMYSVTDEIKAQEAWSHGYTGAGVDVALIDSG